MTRLGTRLKPRGTHAMRWERWHKASRQAVLRRCNFACEGCGDRMKPLEWAHLASRGNVVSEPWCSTPELTAGLCTGKWGELGCHERIDRNLAPELLARLRRDALQRLGTSYGIDPHVGVELILNYPEPLDAIRAAIRLLEMDGWGEFDSLHNCILHEAPIVRLRP